MRVARQFYWRVVPQISEFRAVGTIENQDNSLVSRVPPGRDFVFCRRYPALKTPGYFQMSLRTAAPPNFLPADCVTSVE